MEERREITEEVYNSLEKGDFITCIDNYVDFTIGKKYDIKDFYENEGIRGILIIDDAGDERQIYSLSVMRCFCLSDDKDNVEHPIEDKVNHPSHYTWLKEKCGIEVIDITRHLDFDSGNAVKYILRAGHKSEEGYSNKEKQIEDFKKAIFYINDKIKMLEGES